MNKYLQQQRYNITRANWEKWFNNLSSEAKMYFVASPFKSEEKERVQKSIDELKRTCKEHGFSFDEVFKAMLRSFPKKPVY